jgi:hypothetical protein
MTRQKRTVQVAEARAGVLKGARRKAWGRSLPPALLQGATGGDSGVLLTANYIPETPPVGPKG